MHEPVPMSVLSQPLVSMVTYDPLRVAAAAILLTLLVQHVPRLVRTLWRGGVLRRIKMILARLYMKAPGMRKKLEEGEKKLKERIQGLLLKYRDQPMRSLPAKGLPSQEVLGRLKASSARDKEVWGTGKVSGGVYHGDEEVLKLVSAAMEPFLTANPLHPDLFPSVRQMEAEIVQMTGELFHADAEVKGVLTSGGTESLIMMLYAYREWGRQERGITAAEVIAPRSAHAALSKGAHYFGIRLIYVDVDPTSLQASVSAMEAAITSNTVALVCSVPSFPHGLIDPVQGLAEIALRAKVNLHVDCCLGGYLVPFMAEAGYPMPRFDFLLPGVSSISCDPHKYGCTPKGISVLLYRSAQLRSYQYFMEMEWSGGLYFTPCFAGSRNGAISAGAWAALTHYGREGYIQNTKAIIAAVRHIRERSSELPDLQILGDPLTSVIAFTSSTLNPHAVADTMRAEFQWALISLQSPPAFHLCVTIANAHKSNEFISNLKAAISLVKGLADPSKSDTAAIYGLAESVPDKTYLRSVGESYLDCLFMA